MKNIEDLLSPLIQTQFPTFYQEEGPLFVEFVKQYYKWLESTNQSLYFSRNLLEYKDIDKTIDSFIIHFKETYMKELPLTTEVDERLFLKNILELYQNKGNEQSVKLALRALYNQDSSIYLPGDDLLKPSDGKWVKPKYLEVSPSNRNKTFVNKEIQGTISQAKAFCEECVVKRINGKYINVLFLSNVRGNFVYGEKIVQSSNTNIIDAPSVTGSLTNLTVLNGGANFNVGDEFNVVSNNGKKAKAIVASISSETGKVNFSIDDGGWGFSNNANVYVSDKVLKFENLSNSNNSITEFQLFETVSQNLTSIGFNSAVNAQFFTANTRIFAQGNSSVSNSYAGIVSVSLTTNSVGVIKVSNILGNIVATNTTFKADLVDLAFDTSSNISLFANGVTIETVNSTSNANAYVITSTVSNSTHGSLLLRPMTGNVYSTNSVFRLSNNHSITGTVNTYSSNLYFTAAVVNDSISTAYGTLIGQNSTHIGLDSVLNTFYTNTIFSSIKGQTSNSFANITFVSTGADATFKIGSLDYEETILLTPDLLSSNNTGNVPFIDINLDLSPNNANATGYGFVKFPGADQNTILLDALRFNSTVIGKISSLNSINPGSSYNIDPFVLVYEKDVAGYDRKNFTINITNPTKLFTLGERVYQTYNFSAVQLSVNNFSGTAANGTSMTSFEVNEFVYQSNGTSNIATGFVSSAAVTGGNGTVLLYSVNGSFELTSTHGYQLQTVTSGATANISLINTSATIATTAYGEIDTGSNDSVLFVKRQSFENTFGVGNTLIGITSGSQAVISGVFIDASSNAIGKNALIGANVQTSNAVITSLNVIDSGFGYLDKENVSLEKQGSSYIATAKTSLLNQGVGQGYYKTTGGHLSSDKKLIDSDYFQDYSYEIQSKVPFSKYSEILKKLVHVAGTKMFGKVMIDSFSNNQISISNSISRFLNVEYSDGTSGKSFINSELIVFSNGVSNSTLAFVNNSNIAESISNSSNIIVIEVPDSNNSFVVGREVYMPNANSFSASGNLVAKNSNTSANITILYVVNNYGIFNSSNTISGFISSNVSNTTTTTTTLSKSVEIFGYGNVYSPTISTLTLPVSNTLGSLLSGTINVSNSSVNVIGTSTSFNTIFSNNHWIQIISGATTDLKQIRSVTNSTHMVLRGYPSISNLVSTYKKSSPFISNTEIKMPNSSTNTAYGNVFSYIANSTYFTYYINNVHGSFENANTVEGFINSTTTNTYSLFTAINTLVIANTENDLPDTSTLTGVTSNTSANVSYITVRIEK